MQIKTTMRYHHIPIRMTQLKINDNTNADKDEEKLNHSYITGGNVKLHSHSEKNLAVFYKSKLAISILT